MGAPYSATTVSNYNVNPPPDDGSQSPSNLITWANTKTKIGDPINTAFATSETNTVAAFGKVIGGAAFTNTAVSYTVLSSDQGKEIRATASGITITTPDCTVVGSPFMFAVQNTSNGTITVAGNNPGVQQNVDGSASIIVQPGCGAFLNTDGTNWFTVGSNLIKPVPVQAAFKNLAIKVASNTTVTMSADFVVVTDGNGNFQTLAFNQTINLGTTGANALDTGTIAIDSWYAIHAIAKPDGTKAGLASLSATAPTLPSGYTQFARVGWVQTIHASATLYGTSQQGRRAQYVIGLAQTAATPLIASGAVGTYDLTSPTLAATTVVGNGKFVPTTASSIRIVAFTEYKSGSNGRILIAPSAAYSGTNNGPLGSNGIIFPFVWDGAAAATSSAGVVEMMLESNSIYLASNNAGPAIGCLGWEDNI